MVGAMWLLGARILVNMLALISTLVLARLLAPADFGLVALATAILSILSSMSDLSLASALIQNKQPTDDHLQTAWTMNLLRGVAIGAVLLVLTPVVAAVYRDDRLIPIMFCLAGSAVLSGFTNPHLTNYARQLIFWQEFALSVSSKLAGFVFAIGVAIIFRSYWALVAGQLASQVAMILTSYICKPYTPRFCLRKWRELWSFSVWLSFSQMLNTLNWKFDQLLIGRFLGPTQLGLYATGDNFASLAVREPTQPLLQTLFPAFTALIHDPVRLRVAYRSAQSMVAAVALPIGFGFALVSKPLLTVLLGEKWRDAAIVVEVVACVFATQTIIAPCQALAMAAGHTKSLFGRDVLGFFIRLPLLTAGMFLWGLTGVLAARAASGAIGIGINMQIVQKLTGLSPWAQIMAVHRSILSLLAMIGAVFAMKIAMPAIGEPLTVALALLAQIAIGGVTYLGVHLLIWRLSGRPDGAERQLAGMAGKAWNKIRARS